MNSVDLRPALIGYLPPPEGIRKTGVNYQYHSQFINIGDIVYANAGAMLTSGRNFETWNFRMTAEEVNEKFSKVIFFIPCRIAPPPYDRDGYPYEYVTRFIEKLKIPFFSLGESIQAREYDYEPDFHKSLSPAVVHYLRVIADRSPVVGTRGYYSAEVLNSLGIKNAVPLGCPSLYVNGPFLQKTLLDVPENPEKVAVCYSNYQGNPHSRIDDFLRMAAQNNYHYVEQVFGLLTQVLYYPGKIRAADIYAARQFYKDLAPVLALLKQGRVRYFTNYSLWKDFLGSMEFVFGARMHGLTPALHAGKPAMFIAHDSRVREMCEFFSLPFVAERDLPDSMGINYFLSRCDYSATVSRYPVAYSQFVQTLRENGLGGNIGTDGSIVECWKTKPDLHVVREEEVPQYLVEEIFNLEQQLAICSGIPDEVFVKLSQVSDISQRWYVSRFNRHVD
ncbi:polysaccharide pyruvyl transferase family protein [Pseudomonas asiatica]|uniref:polysaccharide pyruvyl transferase family protein n=1 Tax=Pseudomonas asiatica TaxID=2219225 RepID=UPI0025A0C38C|nr:polysaccharide pyruvyl transferase family protein [Pseudomonas asiatica]WJM52133.1 polysaccharide pyruvyl transferase family protein [Pseudomonas asiatica]